MSEKTWQATCCIAETEAATKATASTSIATATASYLGLYKLYEDELVETQTFSTRLGQAGSTTAIVGVEASGEIEASGMIEEELELGEEEGDAGESSGMLKRRRTRDSQSTSGSIQDIKKSNSMKKFLKEIQKRSKR
ncbi:hypothetical protein MBANPS3_011857 [Mucor bainieri]